MQQVPPVGIWELRMEACALSFKTSNQVGNLNPGSRSFPVPACSALQQSDCNVYPDVLPTSMAELEARVQHCLCDIRFPVHSVRNFLLSAQVRAEHTYTNYACKNLDPNP